MKPGTARASFQVVPRAGPETFVTVPRFHTKSESGAEDFILRAALSLKTIVRTYRIELRCRGVST